MDSKLISIIDQDVSLSQKLVLIKETLATQELEDEQVTKIFWLTLYLLSANSHTENEIGSILTDYICNSPKQAQFLQLLDHQAINKLFLTDDTKLPNPSCIYGLLRFLLKKIPLTDENSKILLFDTIKTHICQILRSQIDYKLNHDLFVSLLVLMSSCNLTMVPFEVLCSPFIRWLSQTPLDASTFDFSSKPSSKHPMINKFYSIPLEKMLKILHFVGKTKKQNGQLILDEILNLLLNSNEIINPLLASLLPSMTPELEQLASQLNEDVIVRVLTIVLGWPLTKQVAQWTILLISKLKILITTTQHSRHLYEIKVRDWYALAEQAAVLAVKQLFHSDLRFGAIEVLSLLLNSLQISSKTFVNVVPYINEAIKIMNQQMIQTNVQQNATHPLDLPISVQGVVLFLEFIASNTPEESLKVLEKSNIQLKDKEGLETLVKRLCKLCLVQMELHKGHPEAYIPLKQSLNTYNTDNNITSIEFESILKGNSWKFVSTRQSSKQDSFQIHDQFIDEESDINLELPSNSKIFGLCGLVNLGNTCYLNSVLQVLFATVEFRRSLFDSFGSFGAIHYQKDAKNSTMLKELQLLFASLLLTKRSAIAPKSLLVSLPEWIREGRQQDASELAKTLFDILDTYWKEHLTKEKMINNNSSSSIEDMDLVNPIVTPNTQKDENSKHIESPIQTIFGGKMETRIVCQECLRVSTKSEDFLDLSLTFPELHSGQDLIDSGSSEIDISEMIEKNMQKEELKDDNMYFCERCNKLVVAEKSHSITRAPNNLMINLVRFRYDYKQQKRSKILTEVVYHEKLELQIFDSFKNDDSNDNQLAHHEVAMSEDGNKNSKECYSLYGVVMHSGRSAEYGHYYAYAKAFDSTDNSLLWFRFNDENVAASSFESFSQITKHISSDVAYILLYRKESVSTMMDSKPLNIPPAIITKVQEDNMRFERELKSNRYTRNTRQSLFGARSRFDRDDNHDSSSGGGNHNFGGSWIS